MSSTTNDERSPGLNIKWLRVMGTIGETQDETQEPEIGSVAKVSISNTSLTSVFALLRSLNYSLLRLCYCISLHLMWSGGLERR